jgi:ribosomal protein S27AE
VVRTTKHTLTCDRCGYTHFIEAWGYKELNVLGDLGWAQYSSAKPRPTYNKPACYPRIKDLCPDCSMQMKLFMNQDMNVWYEDISTLGNLGDLIELRTEINKEIKRKRAT